MEAIRRAAAIIRTGEGETGEHEVDASSDFYVATGSVYDGFATGEFGGFGPPIAGNVHDPPPDGAHDEPTRASLGSGGFSGPAEVLFLVVPFGCA